MSQKISNIRSLIILTINRKSTGSIDELRIIICQGSLYTHCCRASPLLQLGFLVGKWSPSHKALSLWGRVKQCRLSFTHSLEVLHTGRCQVCSKHVATVCNSSLMHVVYRILERSNTCVLPVLGNTLHVSHRILIHHVSPLKLHYNDRKSYLQPLQFCRTWKCLVSLAFWLHAAVKFSFFADKDNAILQRFWHHFFCSM